MINFLKLVSKLLNSLPVRIKNSIFEIVLNFFPISVIKLIPCSYSAYLKCHHPKKGEVVMDCGAHIGNCAILFSRLVGKEGLVVAMEPFEDSFNEINRRIRRLRKTNIIAINKGVWNKTGRFSLSVFENTILCRVSENQKAISSGTFKTIECVTIDEISRELGLKRLDMIKMDIESAEIEALQGAQAAIKRYTPVFAIASYHKRGNTKTYPKVEQILCDYGYAAYTFFPPHLTTCGLYRKNSTFN